MSGINGGATNNLIALSAYQSYRATPATMAAANGEIRTLRHDSYVGRSTYQAGATMAQQQADRVVKAAQSYNSFEDALPHMILASGQHGDAAKAVQSAIMSNDNLRNQALGAYRRARGEA